MVQIITITAIEQNTLECMLYEWLETQTDFEDDCNMNKEKYKLYFHKVIAFLQKNCNDDKIIKKTFDVLGMFYEPEPMVYNIETRQIEYYNKN